MTGTISPFEAFGYSRFGIKHNPRGAHVMWKAGDRTMLAEVTGCERNGVTGATMLHVRQFNGEPMPDVAMGAVRVLVRCDG